MKRIIYAGIILLGLCAASSCEKEGKEAQFPDDYFGYWKLSNVEFYYDGELVDSDFQEAYISFYCEDSDFNDFSLPTELDILFGYEHNNPNDEYTDHIDIDKIKKYDCGYISILSTNYSSGYWLIESIRSYDQGLLWGTQDNKFLELATGIRILDDFQLVECSGNTLRLSAEGIVNIDIYGYSTNSTNITKDGNSHDIKFVFRFERGTEEEFNQCREEYKNEIGY